MYNVRYANNAVLDHTVDQQDSDMVCHDLFRNIYALTEVATYCSRTLSIAKRHLFGRLIGLSIKRKQELARN